MLERVAMEKLISWKKQKNKKALCIIGARQIGKTTLVREFAKKYYSNFIELNFIADIRCKDIFSSSLDVDTIIMNLTAYSRKPLIKGETLILLDEIQECPQARTAIKFLVEDGRFDYIESGSMLGVKLNEVKSYPVGFEEIYQMYPLTFEEFIYANGVSKEIVEYLQKQYDTKQPVSLPIHQTMIQLFQTYIVVGGMPRVVQIFVDTHDIAQVIEEQTSILEAYRQDITKYATNQDKMKIKNVFDSIPSQLNNKNRRFYLNKVDENGRYDKYLNSFEWLIDAGVTLSCFNVEEPAMPITLSEKRNLFKLYMGDTGLLCAACMDDIQFDLLQGDLSVNLGSILENVMAQSIVSNGYRLRYFDSKKYGELDFVIQNGNKLDLLEIKSGNDFKKHAALNKVLMVDQWVFHQSYVFCKDNIQIENGIVYYPWYMIMFYRPKEIKSTIINIDLSNLKI